MDLNIRKCRHNLVFWWEFCTLFELKIANGSGKSEIPVDTTEVDKSTGGLNARLFS
jgi:hypothetical protein